MKKATGITWSLQIKVLITNIYLSGNLNTAAVVLIQISCSFKQCNSVQYSWFVPIGASFMSATSSAPFQMRLVMCASSCAPLQVRLAMCASSGASRPVRLVMTHTLGGRLHHKQIPCRLTFSSPTKTLGRSLHHRQISRRLTGRTGRGASDVVQMTLRIWLGVPDEAHLTRRTWIIHNVFEAHMTWRTWRDAHDEAHLTWRTWRGAYERSANRNTPYAQLYFVLLITSSYLKANLCISQVTYKYICVFIYNIIYIYII